MRLTPTPQRRRATVALLLAVSLLVATTPIRNAQAQVTNVTTTPQSIAAGATITVSGATCGPDDADFTGHQVIATLVEVSSGVAYGSSQSGITATGSWSMTLATEPVAPPGEYEVRIVCQATSTASGITVSVPGPSAAVTVLTPPDGPTMSVSPASGVWPLTITVSGSPCGPTDVAPRTITVDVLDPSMQVVDTAQVNGTGGDWQTTFVIATAQVNPYTVRAQCFTQGTVVASYPDQRVQVTSLPAVLTVSPQTAPPDTILTAQADRCPDPELPQLGGGYFVDFTFEPGTVVEQIFSGATSSATATFTVPAGTAPGTYTVTASCVLEELGSFFEVFAFPAASYVVPTTGTPTTGTGQAYDGADNVNPPDHTSPLQPPSPVAGEQPEPSPISFTG